MKRIIIIVSLCALVGGFSFNAVGQTAGSADADAMYNQIVAIKPPPVDESKIKDEKYVQSYLALRDEAMSKKMDLSRKFYEKYPDNPKAMPLMSQAWMMMAQQGKANLVMIETDKALGTHLSSEAKADVLYVRAYAQIVSAGGPSPKATAAVDEFVKAAPKDDRGAEMLFHLAEEETISAKQLAAYKMIAEQYPDSSAAAQAKGALRQNEAIGKPFELTFTDAISGRKLDLQKDLKGKVVVIDFWATWCGPCVAEMPQMKKTYADFKDKGVEFIGISLDQPEAQGGLTALKSYIAENQIAWPQYYQGNFWNSEFSKSWGINSIPANFIVDANGNLYNVQARGKLDQLIPELLNKRNSKQ